jgi:hypothetical protein
MRRCCVHVHRAFSWAPGACVVCANSEPRQADMGIGDRRLFYYWHSLFDLVTFKGLVRPQRQRHRAPTQELE